MSTNFIENNTGLDLGGETIWEEQQFEAIQDVLGVVSGERQTNITGYLERKFPDITNMVQEECFTFQEEKDNLCLLIGGNDGIRLNLSPRGRSGSEIIMALNRILKKALVDDRLTDEQLDQIADGAMREVYKYGSQRSENPDNEDSGYASENNGFGGINKRVEGWPGKPGR